MDAGVVLAMSSVSIGETETAGELHDRLSVDGAPLMLDTLGRLAAGTVREEVQDESQAIKAPKFSRESSRIDWGRSAVEVARQIRGMYPWPGCRVRLIDEAGVESARLTLVRARPHDGRAVTPGLINDDLHIGAGNGVVEILEVQPEGKRPMPLLSFRNGHPWRPNFRLESLT